MSEFKEFWIVDSEKIRQEELQPSTMFSPNAPKIHVIEYSALEAANARIRELEEKLQRCEHNLTELGHGYQQAIKVAVEREHKLQIASKALERLSQDGEGTNGDRKLSLYECLPELQIEYNERKALARQALKEMGK